MKQKQCIQTYKVYKQKAKLNIDGSHQVSTGLLGLQHVGLFALSLPWPLSITGILSRLILSWALSEQSKRCLKDYDLKIHIDIYGQKQTRRFWNDHFVSKLKFIGFY